MEHLLNSIEARVEGPDFSSGRLHRHTPERQLIYMYVHMYNPTCCETPAAPEQKRRVVGTLLYCRQLPNY